MKHSTCEDFQELASALADERLDSREIRVIREHLEDCPECRRFLNNVYRVRDILRAAEVRDSFHAPSTSFAAVVSRRLDRERLFPQEDDLSPALSAPPFWKRLSGAAAAAVLLIVAGWSWQRLSPSPDTAPVASSHIAHQEGEEDPVASYYRQHALQTMEVTLLGPSEGMELASFDTYGTNFE